VLLVNALYKPTHASGEEPIF